MPKLRPDANPRRVVNVGFLLLFAGLVLLVGLLDVGAGPEIITGPLLLIGSGLGAMASQLGSVTVSSVPDEQSGEVGGLQNTGTQLGASIGTALAGAILISALTASFFTGIQNNPAIPDTVAAQAQTELADRRAVRLRQGPGGGARRGGRPAGRRRRRGRRRERAGADRRPALGARGARADLRCSASSPPATCRSSRQAAAPAAKPGAPPG